MDSADWTAAAEVAVGCVTTDFAVQVRHVRLRSGVPSRPHGLPRCLPECSDPDWAPRFVPEWDAHQTGQELHPEVSRLLQVSPASLTS